MGEMPQAYIVPQGCKAPLLPTEVTVVAAAKDGTGWLGNPVCRIQVASCHQYKHTASVPFRLDIVQVEKWIH